MRAVVVDRFGGPDELTLREAPVPAPGKGEVLVRVAVAGVNYIDVYMRNGSYAKSHTYQTPLPMTIGMEGGGTVAALGEGVQGFAPGERVAYCLARGSYAEYAVVPAWRLVNVPAGVPLEQATALMLQGLTAHYLSHSAFALGPGRSCLVHAAAGGVGQLLVQLAKACGATVLGTVGNADKAQIARARGCDHVILYRESDFREEVMRITGGKGVDVVYDSVGKDTIDRSLRSLKRRGLCVMYGASSGQVAGIAPLDLAEAGSVFFTRPHLADYTADAGEIDARAQALFALYASGKLAVALHDVLDLGAAAEAHRILESRGTRGKLLLRVQA
ncbi:MAG TPA: quinone oxidoreductase [Burkholderiales bacterium]|nr:quinone oxidoreductase [Burkholderiales bacterium]